MFKDYALSNNFWGKIPLFLYYFKLTPDAPFAIFKAIIVGFEIQNVLDITNDSFPQSIPFSIKPPPPIKDKGKIPM